MEKNREIKVTSAKKMRECGAGLAKKLPANIHVVLLEGPMGAGKTTFAQGFGSALGVQRAMASPTFTLINSFEVPKKGLALHHIDLYRIQTADELLPIGIHDLLNKKNDMVLIEWSNKHPHLFQNLPHARVTIRIRGVQRSVRIHYFNA